MRTANLRRSTSFARGIQQLSVILAAATDATEMILLCMNESNKELFEKLKDQLLNMDPVYWIEKYLTLEGDEFRINGKGYKPYADMYRYIGIKALESTAKPIVILKSRQTGISTMASALEMYFMGSGLFGVEGKPPIRIMHAFPQLELAAAYSKAKLNQMISSSIKIADNNSINKKSVSKPKSHMQSLLDTSSPTNDSLHFKQFVGGNHLWIESTGLDADRIMGRSCDLIFFDEVQKTTKQAMGNALKILTTAKYGQQGKGVQIYFGTPRRKGSDYHRMWQSSSQQYFHLGCEKCEKHFAFYTPGSDSWKKIWLHGFIVKCTNCGFEQDKREAAERGKWIALKDESDPDCKLIGFHINQVYMPLFTKEAMINEEPGVHPINTEKVYQNEVMGEFYQGDASPIGPDEIRELCGDKERKFTAIIPPSQEEIVVLGIDYGAKSDLENLANPEKVRAAGQSYSTAVILRAKGPHILSIEYAYKFKKNDVEFKKGIIDQMMRQYSIQLAVGDIGFSQDFSSMLHASYGDRYIVSRAHPKVNDYVKFRHDAYPKELIFERDHYIGELFDLMKKGHVRFPLGDYEKIAWLIEHCSSMEIKPSLSSYGDHTMHYVKGGSPNDGFMALLNAYLAYKFILTKGFKNNNPVLQGKSFKDANKPLIMLGGRPRKF